MKITLFLFAIATILSAYYAREIPKDVNKPNLNNPSLEYEIINPTKFQPPTINNDSQSNNKTFIYDPATNTWTLLNPNDPPPKEGTLVWNQNNDKFLTH